MSFRLAPQTWVLGLKAKGEVDSRNEVERMLDREVHDGEGRRAIVLAVFIVAVLAIYVWAWATGQPEMRELLPTTAWRTVALGTLLIALLIESLTAPASVLLKRADRPPPLGGRLISAFLETSVPTVLTIAATTRGITGAEALQMPPVFLYFPLIILSILRLDGRIAWFTGFVAAGEYLALSWRLLGGSAEAADFAPHVVKAVVLVVSGGFAAAASARIRSWIAKSYALVEARRVADEEKKRLLDRFGQHVSPAVATKLLEAGGGSEVRSVCVMFLDIRDFTSFSERRGPQEVVTYLNSLFGFMIESVNAHNGIINKFLGDGFMAVFGAPLSDGRDCRNALETAREILDGVRVRVASGAIPATRVGIGLHTGPAVTGVVGSESRGEYTVIGDVVNLASRIESLNKELGSCLLVSEEVLAAIGGDRPAGAVERGPVKVKGRQAPVQLFQLG